MEPLGVSFELLTLIIVSILVELTVFMCNLKGRRLKNMSTTQFTYPTIDYTAPFDNVLKYIGSFKTEANLPTDTACLGDVAVVDDIEYVFSGKDWDILGGVSTNCTYEAISPIVLSNNCPNCGASRSNDKKCDYCGTLFS